MDYNLATNLEYCRQIVEQYSSLLYYSHIPTASIGLIVGFYVYLKSRSILSKILLAISFVFAIWATLDLLIWINYDKASVIMSSWAPIEIFSVTLFLLSLYFIDVFCEKRDVSLRKKVLFSLILAPLIISAPTTLYLKGFDARECVALENSLYLQYVFFVKAVTSFSIIIFAIVKYVKADKQFRKQILLLSLGLASFIFAFFVAGFISEKTLDYTYEIYGLFGMVIFIGSLAFLIVRFKTFNIKLVGAQALVFSLIILIGSQFFFIRNNTNRVLTAITLAVTGVIGINLIRSVKKEVAQREKIEKQEKELEGANARLKELDQLKSEFVSLATHQIRGPLTSIKGYASMVLEGDYGDLPRPFKGPIDTIYQSSRSLAVIVDDFLNVSRIEQGRMKYDLTVFDLCKLINEVANEIRPTIENKGLQFSVTTCSESVNISGDYGKLKQVVSNLLDNSSKYTQKGSITVSLNPNLADKKVLLMIKDTGVGIRASTIPHLFQKFSRAEDASKVNILGTGLGLYVAKEMIKAHGGKIWVESEGEGKGATFFVELKLV